METYMTPIISIMHCMINTSPAHFCPFNVISPSPRRPSSSPSSFNQSFEYSFNGQCGSLNMSKPAQFPFHDRVCNRFQAS